MLIRSWSMSMASLLALLLSGVAGATDADRATLDALTHAEHLAGGLIVHLGCGDGRLTTKLATGNQCRVHGLDSGGQNVAAANDSVRGQKLSARVWIDRANISGRLSFEGVLTHSLASRVAPQMASILEGSLLNFLALPESTQR